MYTILSLLPNKKVLFKQIPQFSVACIIAELFYKFHSFTLECGLFLITWLVIDFGSKWVISISKVKSSSQQVLADEK